MPRPTLPQRVLRKLFRPLYPLYYRLLWGRRFPGHRGLEGWVSRWESLADRGDAPQEAAAWDRQYDQGRWDLLGAPEEIPRYAVLAALVRAWSPGRSVLDVGCGDGVLRDLLGSGPQLRYVGIDVSATAIARAEDRLHPGDALFAADAETWEPPERFDALLLNECLYYFRRPRDTAERYWGHRTASGALIVSMFSTPRSRAIRRQLIAALPLAHELELGSRRGVWWIGVFREESP